VVVGDVEGKGLHAGMLAALLVGAVRTAAEFTTSPARILEVLNDSLQNRGHATCLVLRIEASGLITAANAGHLPPYLNGNEVPMEGALPLGAMPDAHFPITQWHLAAGDRLLLMTDGVVEAQDAEGHLFGFERAEDLARHRATAVSLADLAQRFGQTDDITVLSIESQVDVGDPARVFLQSAAV
jgi:serine phosphatase RsbU (regulator of sigma subunit)